MVKEKFEEELFIEDTLHSPDFFIPSKKLCIEINGQNKFYPYSSWKNNFLNFKTILTMKSGYRVFNMNSRKLEGLTKSEEGREKLNSLLQRIINNE